MTDTIHSCSPFCQLPACVSERAIKQIREALAAGPTPGEWHWDSDPVKSDPTGRIRYQVCATGKTVTKIYYSSYEGGPTNAEQDAAYIAACNPAAITELLARLDAAERDAAKSESRVRMFGSIIHNHILAMQAAIIEGELTGHKEGLQWIYNTLWGPGHVPDVDAAKAMGGAQAYFDAETEKEEKRLAAIDAAMAQGVKP